MECIYTNGRWNFPANTKGYLWNILLFTIIPLNNFQNFFAGNRWCWCCWFLLKSIIKINKYSNKIRKHRANYLLWKMFFNLCWAYFEPFSFSFFYLPLIFFSVVGESFTQINCSIRQSSATNARLYDIHPDLSGIHTVDAVAF